MARSEGGVWTAAEERSIKWNKSRSEGKRRKKKEDVSGTCLRTGEDLAKPKWQEQRCDVVETKELLEKERSPPLTKGDLIETTPV